MQGMFTAPDVLQYHNLNQHVQASQFVSVSGRVQRYIDGRFPGGKICVNIIGEWEPFILALSEGDGSDMDRRW